MYAHLWHRLPGSRRVRLALAALLFGAVGALLWYVVFPAIDAWLPVDDTVGF